MIKRLQFSHEITERRNFGNTIVSQEMVVKVDYNPSDETIEAPDVFIYENGIMKCEISKLLDDAEGNPLNTIIEAIDWKSIYLEEKELIDFE